MIGFFKKYMKSKVKIMLVLTLIFTILMVTIVGGFVLVIDGVMRKIGGALDGLIDSVSITGDKESGYSLEYDDETIKKEIQSRLKRAGVNPKTLNLEEDSIYLEKMLEAEIVTNFPKLGKNTQERNDGFDVIQGIIKIERLGSNGQPIKGLNAEDGDYLSYISPEEFKEKLGAAQSDADMSYSTETQSIQRILTQTFNDDGKKDPGTYEAACKPFSNEADIEASLRNYENFFTLGNYNVDDSGNVTIEENIDNILIIKYDKQINVFGKDRSGKSTPDNGETEDIEDHEYTREVIYTVSVTSIAYKSLVSQYSMPFEFLLALLQISQNPEWILEVANLAIEDSEIILTFKEDNISTRSKVTETGRVSSDKHYYDYRIISDGTNVSNNITTELSKVKTWIYEKNTKYSFTDGSVNAEEENQTNEDYENYDVEGKEHGNYTNINTNYNNSTQKKEWIENTETEGDEILGERINENTFLRLWKNSNGKVDIEYEEQEIDGNIVQVPVNGDFIPMDEKGRLVKYKIPKTGRYASPVENNILSATGILFNLLQVSDRTQNQEKLMRYLLYKYTDKSYGITDWHELLDLFKPQNNVYTSGAGGLEQFIRWLHAWESHEGIDSTGTKYKIGSVDGNRTVGYGVDLDANPAHEQKLIAAGYSVNLGDYVDIEFVDSLEQQEIMEAMAYVEKQTAGLSLTQYQKYALISRVYNCGKGGAFTVRNGLNFVTAYKKYWNQEADSKLGEQADFNHEFYTKYMKIPNTSKGVYSQGVQNRRDAEWKLWQTGYYDRIDEYYQEGAGGEFLSVAQSIWEKVCASFTSYGGTSVPPRGITIDCSAYVSWVLYEYGYTEFGGVQTDTGKFYTTNWNEKYGWEEIPVAKGENPIDKLQPGDIFVRYNGKKSTDIHHVYIFVSNGESYDCGQESNWLGKNGKPCGFNDMLTSRNSAPGKIIRVTPPK